MRPQLNLSMKDFASENLYGSEWFAERALASIKPREDDSFDFSDSLLLYVPGTEEEYESIQQIEAPYHELVTKPECAYLEHIAAQVVSLLPNEFEYVDLGPGSEHKEQFIFDEAKKQQKEFMYTPVDISERFLALSSQHAREQGIPVNPVQAPFEELAEKLGPPHVPRFVSLGLTYSNYEPEFILELLKHVAGAGGYVFINSQQRDRVDMEQIRRIYREDVYGISKSKLRLVGLDVDRDVADISTDDGIRAWCTLKTSSPKLEKLGVAAGARLLIFQSLRTDKRSFETQVASVFPKYTLFDTGEPFIGALLQA